MTIFFAGTHFLSGIYLNTWKYNVCSIKLETKVVRLYRIRVQTISLLFIGKYDVHDF